MLGQFYSKCNVVEYCRIHALACIWSDIRRGSVRSRLRVLREYGEMWVFGVSELVDDKELNPCFDL